jgi:predicted CxxxxCH...CXXCH cytochrome family protein
MVRRQLSYTTFIGYIFKLCVLCMILITGCTDQLPDGLSGDLNNGGTCTLCHGNEDNAAPPISTTDASSTSDISVGAHQAHLKASTLSGPITCESCHVVPSSIDQAGHNNGGNAELTWGGLSNKNGLTPIWNRNNETCSSTYCHGAGLGGGTNKTPVWTTVDGTQAECGTCHGNPPPTPHTDSINCFSCHPDTVNQNNEINVSGGFHIDGTVQATGSEHPAGWNAGSQHGVSFFESTANCASCHGSDFNGGTSGISCNQCHTNETSNWKTDCTFCHGGSDNQSGAPPFGVLGETDVSSNAVGAHSAHVQSSSSHSGYDCITCHTKPSSFDNTGHIDGNSGAEVNFNSLAGNNATYSNGSCSTLYCHGNGRSNSASVSWVSNIGQNCDSCHAYYDNSNNLSGEHEKHIKDKNMECSECHKNVINSSNVIINKALHINGSPDVSMDNGTYSGGSCSDLVGCHGSEDW